MYMQTRIPRVKTNYMQLILVLGKVILEYISEGHH